MMMMTSDVVAPGGKEGELWGSEGLGPGEMLNAAFDYYEDDDDNNHVSDINDDDDSDDDKDNNDNSSQVKQH